MGPEVLLHLSVEWLCPFSVFLPSELIAVRAARPSGFRVEEEYGPADARVKPVHFHWTQMNRVGRGELLLLMMRCLS